MKNALLKKEHGFLEIFAPAPENIDILVLDAGFNGNAFEDKCVNTCIFPSDKILKFPRFKSVKSAVSCGMNSLDSVTFSSISSDSALICIRRCLILPEFVLEPCEYKVPFESKFGIYQNLVISLIDLILR